MIDGEAVILTSEKVSTPFAVRFAWNKVAMPNLVNSAGIPPSAFRAGKFPPFKNVALESIPAADGYRCVYRIDIPKNADYSKAIPEYVVDDSRQEQGPFSRVAYFLELEKNDGSRQYIFVSMDKFTDDIRKTGIPVALSGAQFIRKVGRLTVRSNVPGVEQCTDSDGGNIEFLSGNYSTKNGSGLPNASAETFDFDDQPIDSAPGYGCMQIHNWKAGETLLAINHWGNKGVLDVGIGNAAVGNPDWTQSQSAKECKRIQLTVLVK
jgi:sialate O-acetylesterase